MDPMYTAKDAYKAAQHAHTEVHEQALKVANQYVTTLIEAIKAASNDGKTELKWPLKPPAGDRPTTFNLKTTRAQIGRYLRRNDYRWSETQKTTTTGPTYHITWTPNAWSDRCCVQ